MHTADLSLDGADRLTAGVEAAIAKITGTQVIPPAGPGQQPRSAPLAGVNTSTQLPAVVRGAHDGVSRLAGPIRALGLAGAAATLAAMGAAGAYEVRRRRSEVALVTVRGSGPWNQGARTAVQSIVPAAVGAVAGVAISLILIRWLGPSGLSGGSATAAAAKHAGWGMAGGVVLIGFSGAATARRILRPSWGRLHAVAVRVPWELIMVALAAASYYELATRPTPMSADLSQPARVDVLVLLFPLLFIAGWTALAVRGLGAVLPRLAQIGSRWRPALFLASRRLASSSIGALLLVGASGMSLGILSYSITLGRSVAADVAAKSGVFAGSDVSVPLSASYRLPRHFRYPATVVWRAEDKATIYPGGTPADLIAINPRTFAQAAFWDPSLSKEPLARIVARLAKPSTAGLPVVIAGIPAPASTGYLSFFLDTTVPFRVVDVPRAFPGMEPDRPLVVVSLPQLRQELKNTDLPFPLLATAGPELWVQGQASGVLSALQQAGVPVDGAVTAREVASTPSLLSVSWLLGLTEALGGLVGIVTLVGLVLFLHARQRSRVVSGAVTNRMGLTRRAHLASIVAEVATMLLTALVIGTSLALVAARLVVTRLDPLPDISPRLTVQIPVGGLALLAAVVGVVSVGAAAVVQRTSQRTKVAEVLRAGE